MTFEYNRRLGKIGTLLIVSTAVAIPLIVISAYFSGLRQNTLPSALSLSLLTYSGHIIFLIAMKRFADYYRTLAIFANALYGFITAFAGSLLITTIAYGALSSLTDFIESVPSAPSVTYSYSVFIALITFIAVFWFGSFLLALIQGIFFRRALRSLAEKSGERKFSKAGEFMFIGGILTIIAIGVLLFFVGWIFAVQGFFAMKPKETESLRQTEKTTKTMQYYPNCGKENLEEAAFCTRCGTKLQQEPNP